MISGKKIDDAYKDFKKLNETICCEAAYVQSVRALERDFEQPEEPEKFKMTSRPAYVEIDGEKYFPEKEELKCVHITGEWDMPNIMTKTFTRYNNCPMCGEKL